jgi:hypothetical protein
MKLHSPCHPAPRRRTLAAIPGARRAMNPMCIPSDAESSYADRHL